MTDPDEPLFVTLEPPRDGLAGLRARLDAERRRPRRRRWQVAGASALVAGLIVVATIARPAPQSPLPVELDLLRMAVGQLPPPTEVVTLSPDAQATTALQLVPAGNENVVLYLVGSVAGEE